MIVKRFSVVIVLVLMLISSLQLGGTLGWTSNEEELNWRLRDNGPVEIKLKSAVFDPVENGSTMASLNTISSSSGTGYYIVQFPGPIENEWLETLQSSGIEIIEYIPDYAYLVGINSGVKISSNELSSLPVRWAGEYIPEHKIHPQIDVNGSGTVNITVLIFNDENTKNSIELVSELMDLVFSVWSTRSYTGIEGSIRGKFLLDVAMIRNLYWIEPFSPPILSDEASAEIVGGNWTAGSPWGGPGSYVNYLGYDGSGQKVAVVDTGIDGGKDNIVHPDLRVTEFFDYTDPDGTARDGHGHGTHVAGIAAGDGSTGTNDSYGYLYGMGVAPSAELVAQKVFTDDGVSQFPSPNVLMADTYNSGAYVSSNSWGARVYGEYTASSARYDGYVRDALPGTSGEHPMIIVFAAGNDGPHPTTIGAPGTAKNVITVGASENYRPYLASGANNIDEMASFSSRGPTSDGRIKPDIVAPGTYISSALSSETKHSYPFVIDEHYHYLSGTSMAAPHVSGGAATFVQYYEQEYGVKPSPALTKAALVMGANDMNRSGIPNFDEGWGRLNLSNVVRSDGKTFYEDQIKGLTTGDNMTKSVYVGSLDTPLKVVVTWTDPPASPTALTTLVNDLDLTVTGPDGKVYRGNQFYDGWSDPYATDRDDLNNIEAVYIDTNDLKLGEYTIKVRAHNVPIDGVPSTSKVDQDFAMVMSYSPPSSKTNIGFDREVYNTETRPLITLTNTELSDEFSVNITSHLTGDIEYIKLTEIRDDIGVFTSDIELVLSSEAIRNNSQLEVQDDDIITASYLHIDDRTGDPTWTNATARIDVTPPDIFNVSTEILPHATTEISWETDEPSSSKVVYGKTIPPTDTVYSPSPQLEHRILLTELDELSTYYFYLESVDEAGNKEIDDRDGKYYTFNISRLPKILLVDDDNSLNNGGPYDSRMVEDDNKPLYSDALTAAGYPFGEYVVTSGQDGPPLEVMRVYEIVIWVTGYNGYSRTRESTLTTKDISNLESYLDEGGSLWLIGPLLANDLHGRGNFVTSGDSFLRNYMGVEALYSNHEPTVNPVKGVFGTFMEDMEGNIESHWKKGVTRYDVAYELKPRAGAYGVVESGSIRYPYHGVAYERDSFRTAFFAWELSFVRPDEMIDSVKRTIDWLLEPPVGVHVSPPEQTAYGLPGDTVEHKLKVFNTGRNGADTFDVYIEDPHWNHDILYTDGTLIKDSNHNDIPDTGRISVSGSKFIIVSVHVPEDAVYRKDDTISVVFRSSLNPSISGKVNIRTVVPIVPTWHDDFEDGRENWSVDFDNVDTLWESGDPSGSEYGPDSSHSGSNCWGTNIDSLYTDHSVTTLTSPPISLKGVNTAELSFMHWYHIESINDGGIVELSYDGGRTWSRLTPKDGYPYTSGIFGGLGGEAYSGANKVWTQEIFDFYEYIDRTIMLRWHFASGDGSTRAGWYIDDVNISVSQAGIRIDEQVQGGAAQPEEDGTYEIYLSNRGSSDDVFNFQHFSDRGWEVNFYDTLWNPISDNISVDAGKTTNLKVNVTVPSDALPGDVPERTEVVFNSSVDPLVGDTVVLFTYPKAHVLLVNDDGGIGSSDYFKNAVSSTHRTFNEWVIAEQGPPDPNCMASHGSVIWFTGNHRGTHSSSLTDSLPDKHRSAIKAYLDMDGKLYLSSQGAGYIADEEGYVNFMTQYFGFRSRLNWWSYPSSAYGVDGHPIGDMMELDIYKNGEFLEELDNRGIYGEVRGNAREIFRLREGFAAATSVDDTFKTVYTGFDFAAVANADTRESLMQRILAWLDPHTHEVNIGSSLDTKEAAEDTTVEYMVRIRNLGETAESFELEANSENDWHVESYHVNGSGPLADTGIIETEGYKDILLRVSVPQDVQPGITDNVTVYAISVTDPNVTHSLMIKTVIPLPKITCEPDLVTHLANPGDSAVIPLRVHNKGGLNDTVDMDYTSIHGWPYDIRFVSTGSSLTDTDGSGERDTGDVPGLTYVDIELVIEVPVNGTNGATDFGTVTFTSSRDASAAFRTDVKTFVPVTLNWTDDMESGKGGWMTLDNNKGTAWELGNVSGHIYGPGTPYSGDNCWGTNIDSNYTKAIATLTSPAIDLKGASSAEISFYHWYSIWGDDPGNSNDDGGFLEVSTDFGETWDYVIPNEGYNETISPGVYPDRCYGQDSNGWLKGSVNLTEYIDNYILFRFYFYGTSTGAAERWAGWYIDDFRVNATFRPAAVETSIDKESTYISSEGHGNYNVSITNLGARNDSFSIIIGTPIDHGIQSSTWTYDLYHQNGTKLTDTNGDGYADTGKIRPQQTVKILLVVTPPNEADPGSFDEKPLTIVSADDDNITDEYTVHTMVPYTVPFYEDIESGEGAWRHYWISGDNIPDNWEISDVRAYSGNHSWWSGPEIATWKNGGDTALETPYFDLTGAPSDLEMTFWHWYFFESYRYSVMDGGIVEIWDNVTGEWSQIYPERGYDRTLNRLHKNPLGGMEAFTDRESFPLWERENFFLGEYANLTVKIRFRVGWNAADRGIKEGWYIDDLYIGSPLPDVELDTGNIETYSWPGETSTFTFEITNSGKIAENFELSALSSGNISVDILDASWSSITETGLMEPGDRFVLIVNATTDDLLSQGMQEHVTIHVDSASSSLVYRRACINISIPMTGPYDSDFEENATDWSHARMDGMTITDNWQITELYGIGDVWWSGKEDGEWPVGGTSALISPYIDLSDTSPIVELSFLHHYSFGDNFYGYGDGGVIEVWDNETETWTRLVPERGYPGEISRRYGNPLEGQQAFIGSSSGWIYDRFDLSGYGGKIIRVRFVVGWDLENTGKNGWYITDVYMGGIENAVVTVDTYGAIQGDQGETNIVVGRLNITSSDHPISVEQFSFKLSGSGNDGDTAGLKIYVDNDGNGVLEPEFDTYLGGGTFIRKKLRIDISGLNVQPGETMGLLLAVDLSDHAPVGTYMGVSLVDSTGVKVAAPHRVIPFENLITSMVTVHGEDTSPILIGHRPTRDATAVDLRPDISIEFDQTMDKLSFERGVLLTDGEESWSPSEISWDDDHRMVTFKPPLQLDLETDYTVTLNASYVKDERENFLDGNGNGKYEGHPKDDYSWSFTTVTPLEHDTFPPRVETTRPSNGSSGVDIEASVVVTFNESMNLSSTPSIEQTAGHDPGGWEFIGWADNHTAVWTHAPWETYDEIALNISDYKDRAGNVGEPYTWSFMTMVTPHDSDWPVFKHDQRRTGASPFETDIEDGGIQWIFETEGEVIMQPVVGEDDIIYVGDHDGYLYALTRTGELRWSKKLTDGVLHASPSVGSDGTIYMGCSEGYMYAIEQDGTLLWSVNPAYDGIMSSPIIGEDGTLFVGSLDGNLYAISPNGTLLWKFRTGGPISSSPAFADDTIYINSFDGSLYAIGVNGTLRWRFDTGQWSWSYNSPAVDENGRVYLGMNVMGDGHLFALNSEGKQIWNHTLNGSVTTSPSIAPSGSVYIGVSTKEEGILRAFRSNGTHLWDYTEAVPNSISDISIDNTGNLFFGSDRLHAVHPDGTEMWLFSPIDMNKGFFNSPTIASKNIIYITHTEGYLYAIGEELEPPSSRADPEGSLPKYTNKRNFTIPFHANDPIGLEKITLFYRINGGEWQMFDTIYLNGTACSSFFNFTAATEGYYEFFTKTENIVGRKELEKTEPEAMTTVDTVEPRSTVGDEEIVYHPQMWFHVMLSVDDDTRLERVLLYSKKDDGPWEVWKNISLVDQELSIYEGVFNFTTSDEGVYDFYSVAIDAAGNMEYKSPTSEYTVVVDKTAPEVLSHRPYSDAIDVMTDTHIEVTFDEDIDGSSVEVWLKKEEGGIVIGDWIVSESDTIIFTPHGPLEHSTNYSVTLRAGDLAGNTVEISWRFETADAKEEYTEEGSQEELSEELGLFLMILMMILFAIAVMVFYLSYSPVIRKRRWKRYRKTNLSDYEKEYFR